MADNSSSEELPPGMGELINLPDNSSDGPIVSELAQSGITSEDVESLFQQRFGVQGQESGTPPPDSSATAPDIESTDVDGDSDEEDDDDDSTDDSGTGEFDGIEFDDGSRLTRAEAQQLAQFSQLLAANPEVAERIQLAFSNPEELARRVMGQQAPPPPPPPVVTPPQAPQINVEDLDLDDPNVRTLWDLQRLQAQQVQQLSDYVQRHEGLLTTQQEQENQALLSRATSSFQTDRSLSDVEMQTVRDVAARMQILPGLLSGVDPITGQKRPVSKLDAIEQAYDIALNSIPELRNKTIQAAVEEQRKSNTRKRKASSVSGGSGSVPRIAPGPQNPAETRKALTSAVAQMMNGTFVENEN